MKYKNGLNKAESRKYLKSFFSTFMFIFIKAMNRNSVTTEITRRKNIVASGEKVSNTILDHMNDIPQKSIAAITVIWVIMFFIKSLIQLCR